jgi:hypothetical protein
MNRVVEAQLPHIPGACALNPSTKQIAFTKGQPSTFIDVLGELPRATWKEKCLEIEGVEYQYNVWHSVADCESDLHKYFKVLLQKDATTSPFEMF